MRVVSIQGSPRRNGNSATLAQTVCDRLAAGGAEIATHHLNDLQFGGCQGCEACKHKSDRCILGDDLELVLEDIRSADVLVMSTSVYWGDVTSQLKGCIDRFYSFLKPGFMQGGDMHRLASGKQLVFIQAQGAPDESQFGNIFERYNAFFEQLQFFTACHCIRGCNLNAYGEVVTREDLLNRARAVAVKIEEKWEAMARNGM